MFQNILICKLFEFKLKANRRKSHTLKCALEFHNTKDEIPKPHLEN